MGLPRNLGDPAASIPQGGAAEDRREEASSKEVGPERAKAVADRLANAGAEAAAAQLLPFIYTDRMQGGSFLYGAVSIETGDCKGKKTAVLHVAQVIEPGKRWIIHNELEEPLRAVKARLAKCTAEEGDWPVATTREPIKGGKDIDSWIADLVKQWEGKGYEVEVKDEKEIRLD